MIALLLLAAAAPRAWGHGFSLSLSGNTLVATSNDWPANGNPNLFNEEFDLIGGEWQTDHGGAGSGFFGTGKSLRFDAYTPLWYSDGGPAVLVDPNSISLSIDGTGGSIEIDENLVLPAGYSISGDTSHEFLFTLHGSTIPAGVYGIGYRVSGNPTGGQPYVPTAMLVPTWMTGDFDPGPQPLDPSSPLQLAQRAIYAAIVPEPSSFVLLAAGLGAMAAAAWRRRTRLVA